MKDRASTREELLQIWEELEVVLNDVLDALETNLPAQQMQMFRDFVANREFGVVAEWLRYCLQEYEISVPAAVDAQLRKAEIMMGLPSPTQEQP